jgi:hypothetical protein
MTFIRMEPELNSVEKQHGSIAAHGQHRRSPYAGLFLDPARSAASRHRRTISATMMYVPTINRMASIITYPAEVVRDKLRSLRVVAKMTVYTKAGPERSVP